MNIQIFGKSKSFDTKKAERYFKERRISFQSIDLLRFGLSGKEFDSVLRAVGGIDNLIDWDSKDSDILILHYTEDSRAKEDKVFDRPELMKAPLSETANRPPWAMPRKSGKHGNNTKAVLSDGKDRFFRYKDHFFVKKACKERGKVVCYEKSPFGSLGNGQRTGLGPAHPAADFGRGGYC